MDAHKATGTDSVHSVLVSSVDSTKVTVFQLADKVFEIRTTGCGTARVKKERTNLGFRVIKQCLLEHQRVNPSHINLVIHSKLGFDFAIRKVMILILEEQVSIQPMLDTSEGKAVKVFRGAHIAEAFAIIVELADGLRTRKNGRRDVPRDILALEPDVVFPKRMCGSGKDWTDRRGIPKKVFTLGMPPRKGLESDTIKTITAERELA
jgi:hypothetical protein